MANLILVCGLPGSGKSTYLSQFRRNLNCKVVSRDEIRFSIVDESEAYFSHEDEVCKNMWNQINEALAADKNTYVDQTSLTPDSRSYLLKHITSHYDELIIIWFNISKETCLERNENRIDTRAYVPRGVIRRMAIQMVPPSIEEGFDKIYIYDENNKLTLQETKNE